MKTQSHHSPPRAVTARMTHFAAPGSPLDGKLIPMDWGRLAFRGKVEALVRTGLARDWREGCSLLGQHGAAIGRLKRARTGEGNRQEKRWWDR